MYLKQVFGWLGWLLLLLDTIYIHSSKIIILQKAVLTACRMG